VHNSVVELRNICNHPYISQLHNEEVLLDLFATIEGSFFGANYLLLMKHCSISGS